MTLRTARGGSLLLQFHAWRGFGRDRGLFWFEYRAGFITLAIERDLIGDRLRGVVNRLRQVMAGLR